MPPAGKTHPRSGINQLCVYSSGVIGRLVPEDVIGLIRYLCEHAAPATPA
jgi:hypothetical protein